MFLKNRLFVLFKTLKSYQRYQNQFSKMTTFTSAHFEEFHTPELKYLADIFQKNQYELRIVGGAVRDFLMDIKPKDVDFATTATPSEMKNMFETEGVRLINRNGEKHGTITPRINDKENFEITSLMMVNIDNQTGQRDITWTRDWKVDAGRRDLTINAMFLGLDGKLYDYFGGQDDLKNRRVRFVEDGGQRIREDYSRILRYFRFYGRIVTEPNAHDPEAIEAIKNNAAGLAGISGERKWVELTKIFAGNHVQSLVEKMVELRLHPHLGFPEEVNIEEFRALCARSFHLDLLPSSLLASLIRSEDQVLRLFITLKFSKLIRDGCHFIATHRHLAHNLRHYQRNCLIMAEKNADYPVYVAELLKYLGDTESLKEFREWQPPKFPLNGKEILNKGYYPGKSFNSLIKVLKESWFDSDYTLTKDQLLDKVPEILKSLTQDGDEAARTQKKKKVN